MKNWINYLEELSFKEKLVKDAYNRILDNQKLSQMPLFIKREFKKLDEEIVRKYNKKWWQFWR